MQFCARDHLAWVKALVAMLIVAPAILLGFVALWRLCQLLGRLRWVGLSLEHIWPLLLVLPTSLWLLRHGMKEVGHSARDAALRLLRVGSACLVAGGGAFIYMEHVRLGGGDHAFIGRVVTGAGAMAAVLATLLLYRRVRWVRRVRSGRIAGWAIRSLDELGELPRLKFFVPCKQYEVCDVLVQSVVSESAYRGKSIDCPVALVPVRLWRSSLRHALDDRGGSGGVT